MTNSDQLLLDLPLPLSQLLRRAANAKASSDRLLTSYYAWEAALKLLGSVAIVEYAALNQRDAEIDELLKRLARPTVGEWWHFVRRLLPVLAENGDPGFSEARRLVLGRMRDDLPFAAGLDNALKETLGQEGGTRVTVRLTELFDRLVKWRNQEIAHGAAGQRDAAHYETLSRAMFSGVRDLLGKLDVLAGRRLLYVTDVSSIASGDRQVECFELRGESVKRIEPILFPRTDTSFSVLPERVYLCAGGERDDDSSAVPPDFRSMHPLLVFDADEENTFFLNGRRGKRKAEYLCYTTGTHRSYEGLERDHRELLVEVLGASADTDVQSTWSPVEQDEDELGPPASTHTLGEFELLSKIGRGGMGIVYRAWQPSLGRQVAVKSLIRSGEEAAEQRFAREIRALGCVEHPNVAKIYTSGIDGDNWYYAMELVEGAALSEVQRVLASTSAAEIRTHEWQEAISTACERARSRERSLSSDSRTAPPESTTQRVSAPASSRSGAPTPPNTPAPVDHVVEVVRQVAEATHALHQRRIVHRDIKPGNIMISSDGQRAILMDLGLAQLTGESIEDLTKSQQFVGTLRYASPEQIICSRDLDGRTDVYSLGATLWELLTLKPLYGATDETPPHDLLIAVQQKTPERIRNLNPHVRADLEAIVFMSLEKDPRKRYQTAAHLAEDLKRWQEGEPVHARKLTPWYFLERKLARNKKKVAGVAAGMLAAAILIGVIITLVFDDSELRAKQAVAIKALPGLDGGWWFDESPWLIPPVRSVIAHEVLEGKVPLGDGPGLATNPYKQQVVKDLREWFEASLVRTPRDLREKLRDLVDHLDMLTQADTKKEQRQEILEKLLTMLMDMDREPEPAATVHARAVIRHQLAQLNRDKATTYAQEWELAKRLYETALDRYEESNEIALRALCTMDLGHHCSTLLLDAQSGDVRQDTVQRMVECFEEAINWEGAPEVFQVHARANYGSAILKTKDFDTTDDWYDKALDSARTHKLIAGGERPNHPLVPHVHERWAWSLMDQWRVEEARDHFQTASDMRWQQGLRDDPAAWPRYFHDRHGLSMALRYCGKLQEAENAYDQIIGTDSTQGEIHDRVKEYQAALASRGSVHELGQLTQALRGRIRNSSERRADCALYGRSFERNAEEHLTRAAKLYSVAKRISSQRGNDANSAIMGYKRVLALLLKGDKNTAVEELKNLPSGDFVTNSDSYAWRLNNLNRAVKAFMESPGESRRKALRAFLRQQERTRYLPANIDRDTYELRLLAARQLLKDGELSPNSKDRAGDAYSYIATVINDIEERRGQASKDEVDTFMGRYWDLALDAVCQTNPQKAARHFTEGPQRSWKDGDRKTPVVAVHLPHAAGSFGLAILLEPPRRQSARPKVRFFHLPFGRKEIPQSPTRSSRLSVPRELEQYLRRRDWPLPEDEESVVWCGEAEDWGFLLTQDLDVFTPVILTGGRDDEPQ